MGKEYRMVNKQRIREVYKVIEDPNNLIPTGNGANQPIKQTDKKIVYCHHCNIKLHYMSLHHHIYSIKHKVNEAKKDNQPTLVSDTSISTTP